MGAKNSTPWKKTWFSKKSGNIRRNKVTPLQVKPAKERGENAVSLSKLRRESSPTLSPELLKSESPTALYLEKVEVTDIDTVENGDQDTADIIELDKVEETDLAAGENYKEIRYSDFAEVKTYYFNSFKQEWYVYKRTELVPMVRLELEKTEPITNNQDNNNDSKKNITNMFTAPCFKQ